MNVTTFSQNFSRIIKVIGSTPFIILVSLPSLVFIGFNIYFTTNIISLIINSLELASLFGKMVRGFIYLSTTLLIMYPLLETLFRTTGGTVSKAEESYLKLFDRVAIALLIVTAGLYLSCWLGLIGTGIQVDVMKPKPNLSSFESFINLFFSIEVVDSKRDITFIEGIIGLSVFGFIYFTDKAAGICLITMKDILFPDIVPAKKGHDKINDKQDEAIIAEFKKKRDEVRTLLNKSDIDQPDFNKAKGMTGNLKSYTTKVFEDSNKNFIATEVRELEKLLKEKENEVK
jgi:hypothetical protein